MATTTTNFGWDIPQSTDLVKDGATAIAALGQDIDTAMVDLKGGTTGQVLAKASGTDLDFSWVAQDDSNAIQNAIVDAKGDLIGATAADTPARLAVGTNGQVLTADSTAATGLKWASPAGGVTFVGCKLFATAGQSLTSGVTTDITWDSESFDTDGFHSTSTNTQRITIPTGKNGYYSFTAYMSFDPGATGERGLYIQKNGTTNIINFNIKGSTIYPSSGVTIMDYATAGDYYIVRAFQDNGSTQTLNKNTPWSGFACQFIGA
jgi:hypothetical protein